MNVTVIIPYTPNASRAEPYRRVREHLDGWTVMVAENDAPLYCRAKVLNTAIAAADTEIVVINDADSLVPHIQIREAVRLAAEQPGLVYAYTVYVRLDEHGRRGLVIHEAPSHGCVAIRRDCFLEVGYDEAYEGWGPEDQDFNRRAPWPVRRVPGELEHLWHGERRSDDSPLDTPAEAVSANWQRHHG